MTSITQTITPLDQTERAGPDFHALRQAAIDKIQSLVDQRNGWTDFNIHDPGVTLLEAIAWAMSDLSYRTETPSYWDKRVCLDRPILLLDEDHDALTDHPGAPGTPDAGQRSSTPNPVDPTSPSDARSEDEAGQDQRPSGPPDPSDSLLCWLRFSLDYFDQLAPEDEGPTSEPVLADRWHAFREGISCVEPDTEDIPLDRVSERIRAWLISGAVDRANWPTDDEVSRPDNRPPGAHRLAKHVCDELSAGLGWSPDLVEVLAALETAPGLRFEPTTFEDDEGRSVVWPADRAQVRSVAPCHETDYLVHLSRWLEGAAPDAKVRRAWLVRGTAAGVAWDAKTRPASSSDNPGAVSLLIDPDDREDTSRAESQADATQRHAQLLTKCHRAFDSAAPDRRYWSSEDLTPGHHAPRCLGDDLVIGAVGTQQVHLKGRILVRPDRDPREVEDLARESLIAYLYFGTDNPDDEARLGDPATVTGWPEPQKVWRGWTPGAPLQISEVESLLLDLDGVERVDGVRACVEGGRWQDRTLPIDRFCVPTRGDWRLDAKRISDLLRRGVG